MPTGREQPPRVSVVVPGAFPGLPSYRVPAGMEKPGAGCRVAVPFRKAVLTGIVTPGEPPALPEGKAEREILTRIDEEPFLSPAFLDVLLRAATYYFVPPGEMLRAAVPTRLLTLVPDLASSREASGAAILRPAGAPVERLWQAGSGTTESLACLRRRPALRAAWEKLGAFGRAATAAELRAAGISSEQTREMVRVNVATVHERSTRADLGVHAGEPDLRGPVVPNAAQSAAVAAVVESVRSRRGETFLLDGVTGSGKTEVYLLALEAACRAGLQGILLVPEIALAPALVRRVVARFGERVSLLHSSLSDGERAAEWERARRGEVDAVVGPRSAIFAPLPQLGLVVVDESHEASYKQAESPRYDARTVARVRAHAEKATLVLGSATPSMEQEEAVREGRVRRLRLPDRPGARRRATVEVVDLRAEAARTGDHGRVLFASRTRELLAGSLERDEQVIVLLNRRGFAPTLLCRACGNDFRCPDCSVARTYHLSGERLLCHYCGEAIPRPERCPSCASGVLMPVGFGTERLAERFEEIFPGVAYAVLDRDAASRRGGAAGILADFESGRARALLGTQMVAKGHDFPNATTLAVLDADALLSFPDFRAAERTFQLVTQAAGRVGRGERPGLVAVQTARPEHEAILAAIAQDAERFARSELRFRRTLGYPPFGHLLLALWTGHDAGRAAEASRNGRSALLGSGIGALRHVRLYGPAPAPLERLRGLYRFQLLLRSESREALRETGSFLAGLPKPPHLDRDPQDLM